MATILPKTTEGRITHLTENKGRSLDSVLLHFQLIIFFLVLGVIVVSVLYLAEFNHLATQGVIIDELESTRKRLVIENEVWRMKISQLASLDVITQQEAVNKMLPLQEVTYVE